MHIPSREPRWATHALLGGSLAAALSAVALVWRGERETGHAAAPLNAISHWLWPAEALRQDDVSWRYSGTGTLIHFGSSMLWAACYASLRALRPAPDMRNAITDAAAVTGVAAAVDLVVVPKRLTPGFEERLSPRGLWLVYTGFAAGLAIAGVIAARR